MARAAFVTLFAVASPALLSIVSCSLSSAGTDWEYPGGDTPYEEATSLFAEGDAGRVTFSTNAASYNSARGYTVWAGIEGLAVPEGGPFGEATCEVSKEAGDANAGYGLVFCRGRNVSGDDSMYVLMINARRQFAVGKAVNARYDPIRSWTETPALLPGWGAANRLRVARDAERSRFTVWCNGTAVCEFEDDAEVGSDGGAGYLVVISPYDDFPETTVKVVFSR